MRKTFAAAMMVVGLAASPALALQAVVTQIDKNSDGTMTYHFAVKVDPGETLTPGEAKGSSDFVTIYNFYGLVDGSPKTPAGWAFSSEPFGRTPSLDGYPLVLPIDVPGTPNLTWTVTKPAAAGTIEGFTATTRVATITQGMYSGQASMPLPAVQGVAAGTPGLPDPASKQAVIGLLPTPSFLASLK